MPHHFAINCNKYDVNKSHSVQIAPTRGLNANQNPQRGDAIDDQIPHICPTPPPPPLWVNIDRCIILNSENKKKKDRQAGQSRDVLWWLITASC